MLTRRVAYLGLLACLISATALGMQPGRSANLFVEQETESEAPTEEPGEEEVESDCGALVRRRGTMVDHSSEVLQVEISKPPRSEGMKVSFSCTVARQVARNGFGGPLRL